MLSGAQGYQACLVQLKNQAVLVLCTGVVAVGHLILSCAAHHLDLQQQQPAAIVTKPARSVSPNVSELIRSGLPC